MKNFKNLVYFLALGLFVSCGQSGFTKDAAGITALGEELNNEFGKDAYYTSFTVVDSGSTGDIVSATVTEDPSSNKMGEWSSLRGAWSQTSEITLELPEGVKAEEFMFQLGDLVKMETLGKVVEDAKKRLKEEKDIEPNVNMISVTAPENGDFETMEYYIILKPESGGTSFTFRYKLDGEFIEMDY